MGSKRVTAWRQTGCIWYPTSCSTSCKGFCLLRVVPSILCITKRMREQSRIKNFSGGGVGSWLYFGRTLAKWCCESCGLLEIDGLSREMTFQSDICPSPRNVKMWEIWWLQAFGQKNFFVAADSIKSESGCHLPPKPLSIKPLFCGEFYRSGQRWGEILNFPPLASN